MHKMKYIVNNEEKMMQHFVWADIIHNFTDSFNLFNTTRRNWKIYFKRTCVLGYCFRRSCAKRARYIFSV